MDRKLNQELHKAAAMTFEELAFMFLEPEYEENKSDRDDRYEAAAIIEFLGAKSGKLIMSACAGLIRSIAENMLGEEDISEQQQRDAFGEIANVICGNVLPRVVGFKEVFNLKAPEIVKISKIPDDFDQKATAEASISLNDGKAGLRLFFDEKNTE